MVKNKGLVIKTNLVENNLKFVHVYNKGEHMPFKGRTFNVNTKYSEIIEWANKPVDNFIEWINFI